MKYLLYFIPLLLLFSTCKQPDSGPKTTYTIKGRVMNGTTGATYANQAISASVHTRDPGSIGGRGADLGSGQTDDQGNFILSYTQTDINYDYAAITIASNFFILGNIQVNKNIDTTFYLSTLGNLKIFLHPVKSLQFPNDTLFLTYGALNLGQKTDTLTQTFNGLYKTVRLQTPYTGIFWGIGSKNESQNKILQIPINGDPIVDSVTVNY